MYAISRLILAYRNDHVSCSYRVYGDHRIEVDWGKWFGGKHRQKPGGIVNTGRNLRRARGAVHHIRPQNNKRRVVLPGNLDIDNFGETRGRSRRRARRCTAAKKRIAIFSRNRARTPRLQPFVSDFFFFSSTSFSGNKTHYSIRWGFFFRISVLRRPLTRNRVAKWRRNRLRNVKDGISKAKIKFVQYALCAPFADNCDPRQRLEIYVKYPSFYPM